MIASRNAGGKVSCKNLGFNKSAAEKRLTKNLFWDELCPKSVSRITYKKLAIMQI